MSSFETARITAYELGFLDFAVIESEDPSELPNIAVMLFPYLPYSETVLVSAYYIASNTAYHAANTLGIMLHESGNRFVPDRLLPQRQIAEKANLGRIGKNGLLHTCNFGSRVVIQTAFTDIETGGCGTELPKDFCRNCKACADACPTGAIDSANGINPSMCLRAKMDTAPYSEETANKLTTYLGCELCMRACPHNFKLRSETIPREIETAFAPERVISGVAKQDAKKYFGSNIRYSRLVFEAEVFQKRSSE